MKILGSVSVIKFNLILLIVVSFTTFSSVYSSSETFLDEEAMLLSGLAKYETERTKLLEALFLVSFEEYDSNLVSYIVDRNKNWAQKVLSSQTDYSDSEKIAASCIIAQDFADYNIGSTSRFMRKNNIEISMGNSHFAADIDRYIVRKMPIDSINGMNFPQKYKNAYVEHCSEDIINSLKEEIAEIVSGNKNKSFPLYFYLEPYVHQTGDVALLEELWYSDKREFQQAAVYIMGRSNNGGVVEEKAIQLLKKSVEKPMERNDLSYINSFLSQKEPNENLQEFIIELLEEPIYLFDDRYLIAKHLDTDVLNNHSDLNYRLKRLIKNEKSFLEELTNSIQKLE